LAHESRHPTIVRRALRKADQLAGVIFDDKAKPASVLYCKCLAPLTFAKFVRRPPTVPAPVGFVKRLDMHKNKQHERQQGVSPAWAYRNHVFAYVEKEDTPRPLLFQPGPERAIGRL